MAASDQAEGRGRARANRGCGHCFLLVCRWNSSHRVDQRVSPPGDPSAPGCHRVVRQHLRIVTPGVCRGLTNGRQTLDMTGVTPSHPKPAEGDCRSSADAESESGGVEARPCPTVMITEPGRTPLHLVVRRPVDVGRDCDGLLLADAELSRQHLRLSATAGRLVVADLGSTNGTKLDGADLSGPTRVAPGQVVTFGHCRLELVAPENGRAASIAADPLRRTSIDIVADAAVADPMPPHAVRGRDVDDRVLRHRAVDPPHGGAG